MVHNQEHITGQLPKNAVKFRYLNHLVVWEAYMHITKNKSNSTLTRNTAIPLTDRNAVLKSHTNAPYELGV